LIFDLLTSPVETQDQEMGMEQLEEIHCRIRDLYIQVQELELEVFSMERKIDLIEKKYNERISLMIEMFKGGQ